MSLRQAIVDVSKKLPSLFILIKRNDYFAKIQRDPIVYAMSTCRLNHLHRYKRFEKYIIITKLFSFDDNNNETD